MPKHDFRTSIIELCRADSGSLTILSSLRASARGFAPHGLMEQGITSENIAYA